ncbi:FUSC family protein [Streptomyces sp. NPDC006326]|uniref:FUSC family protein n=1 Tax=Streptomyces sp. NPDC006326 TaxID=3156752 RepID=UPI0033ADA5D0
MATEPRGGAGGDRSGADTGWAPALSRAAGELRGGTGPWPSAARRAIRLTLAACTGFYGFLYGLDRPVGATYALFAAVSLGGLSRIPGTGRQRAAVIGRALPAACLLVLVGTWLAVRDWAAVVGMLVIGFCLAFSAAAGPRTAGAVPGLQLMYILPCFPPYAPQSLGDRLTGAAAGALLLLVAERYLLPDPPVPTYRERTADAAATAARLAAALARVPHVVSGALAAQASAAGESLRSSRVPEAERPAGPGLRQRALAHAGLAARTLLGRLHNLPPPPAGRSPAPPGLELVGAVQATADAVARELREGGRPEGAEELRRRRARVATTAPAPVAEVRRRQALLLEVADAALALRTAADMAVRGRAAVAEADHPTGRFWYAQQSEAALYRHRLAGHAGPRSVFFQNAVRISLALAAARTVAALGSLPHGFWAMLAVLSLTRTTAVQTRAAVRAALIGTCLGALAAAGVLSLTGTASTVYAFVLPPLMLAAFCIGPVRGVGWSQGLFTLVIALVFAQLSPATWQLAEVRFVDVLIGSSIGFVCGLLAWPRGAHDELGRAVARLLAECGDHVQQTTDGVALRGPAARPGGGQAVFDDRESRVRHALIMAETAYAQYQSETQRPPGPGPDWQAVLMTGHHVLWGARRVRELSDGGPPGAEAAALVREYGSTVGRGMQRAAVRLAPPKGSDAPAPAPDRPRPPLPLDGFGADEPPLFFTALVWLDSLTTDLEHMSGPPARVPHS